MDRLSSMSRAAITALLAGTVGTGGHAQSPSPSPSPSPSAQPASPDAALVATSVSASDRQFVMKTIEGGRVEVELARLAQQQAAGDAVRAFAARLLAEHGRGNDELANLARRKSLALPAAAPTPARDDVARLKALSGQAFDRAYIERILSGHQAMVAAFENEIRDGQDADIKNFAARTLSTLQQHLQLARAVQDGLPRS